MPALRPPEPLSAEHDLTSFENGQHASLDEWLKRRALASEGLSARTYVVCPVDAPKCVVGYFSIATAMAQRAALPSAKLRQGMPDQIPLLLVGRLAVDRTWQGKGLGSALLAAALRKCQAAASIVGARGVVVHAIDDKAAAFYEAHGFSRSPLGELVLFMPHSDGSAPS
ncbi:MAG: GNAT family N-acetyltransferase [Bosea sp. (in: a-proteobacteria)]